MNSKLNAASEGLLSSAERWSPADAELWGRWRASLTAEQRSDALMPLQALLSGLVAFRDWENQARPGPGIDFHPHLHAVRTGYGWGLGLIARLRSNGAPQSALVGVPVGEPESSLRALERSLREALRVAERLLELPRVDAGMFQDACDLFLAELERNLFFLPPEPLEFSNASELVQPEGLVPQLESWESEAARTASMIAFLALLRDHRFLGIADGQLREPDGIFRSHLVAAAVRRELRVLSRFLLVQGVQTFADELERRLLSVEAIASSIHAKSRSLLNDPLPEPRLRGADAPAVERMHGDIVELRNTVRDAAKKLHALGRPAQAERADRKSERVQRNLQQEIWAFRLILRAFLAKASAVFAAGLGQYDEGSLDFVGEFLRHFRLFGLRLSRGTMYSRRGQLTRAVSALNDRRTVDDATLGLATEECRLFLEHLDDALADLPESQVMPFDKTKAAAELRAYLTAVKQQSS
jgi:ADP-ribose pyrophosphatase YjhB (NUDIX family)